MEIEIKKPTPVKQSRCHIILSLCVKMSACCAKMICEAVECALSFLDYKQYN